MSSNAFPNLARHEDLEAFRAHLRGIDAAFDVEARLEGADGPFGRGITVFGRELTNRFACQPMEGWDGSPDGRPGPLTFRRWRNFGRSAAALVWGGEAYAVRFDGRANPNQLAQGGTAETRRDLAALRAEWLAGRREVGLTESGAAIGLQLTHSGRWARPTGVSAPRAAFRHSLLDRRCGLDADRPLLRDDELEAIGEDFVRAALSAREAGFDFVDVKCCHGYLLHELLGARSREGPYGGDLAGRTRLLLRIIAEIRRQVPGIGIGLRLSLVEVAPFGAGPDGVGRLLAPAPYLEGFGVDPLRPDRFDLEEPRALLALLAKAGVDALNLSIGSPYACPHLQRPAARPPCDGYLPPRDPLAEVLEHLRLARFVKAAWPQWPLVGSAWTYLQEWLPHLAQAELRAGHQDFIGLGRMLLSHPELPADLLAGRSPDRRRLCRTLSDCTTSARRGLPSGCYPLDPFYRSLPEAKRLRASRRR